MSDDIHDIVIVGGGLAAAKAAETVRSDGFDGNVTVITEEPERPYERPPLSKGFLTGDKTVDEVYVHDADFYAQQNIALRVGDAVTELDTASGEVLTRSGDRLPYDRLLLATGATPRRLSLSDRPLDGIVVLRTLADSRRLAERLRAVDHVTVVGAGWIGCEVAAAARTLGAQVTMVDPLDVPLVRVLGAEVGRVFADLHTDHDVDVRMGLGVDQAGGTDTVEQVTLTDGSTIDTQLVVVGIGVTPRVDLAEGARLGVDDGIVVDQTLATHDPRILAAGDAARAWHPSLGRHIRVEHWANALNQGQTAGHNLLGAGESYDRLPYFFSDQYDLGMEYTGHAEDWDRVVFRGAPERREFLAFWLRDGRVIAGMNVNIWDVMDQIQTLIRSGVQVDPSRLANPDIPLEQLAPR
ncbi:MAG: NAD(P)/FAD-dependent oxidoreductase [Nitriliruptorales bacterium]|nr:NAD(P)/FAD-dependent oxidoreductase [Nitriliruptorales bacterium]